MSVACVSSVHFASDHRLARDLLHGMLAWYGAAYVKQIYSEYKRLRPIGVRAPRPTATVGVLP